MPGLESKSEPPKHDDKTNDKKKKDEKKTKEMSAEDVALKAKLETLASTLLSSAANEAATKDVLAQLKTEIQNSTGSMTALPKPLKFLRPHYKSLVSYFSSAFPFDQHRSLFAAILSIVAMTASDESDRDRDTLRYKLLSKDIDIGVWGHEYVRHLAGQLGRELEKRRQEAAAAANASSDATNTTASTTTATTSTTTSTSSSSSSASSSSSSTTPSSSTSTPTPPPAPINCSTEELLSLVDVIVPFFLSHNSFVDATDFLIETEKVDRLKELLTADNHDRIGRYILKCADYIADVDEQRRMISVAFDSWLRFKNYPDALRVALKLNDHKRAYECFQACQDDRLMQKQLAFILAAQRVTLTDLQADEELMEISGNCKLNTYYHQLASDLDVKEPKHPDDIYKAWLEEGGTAAARRNRPTTTTTTTTTGVDSAKQNLASTFVNAFVNVGFGRDLLITPAGSEWLYKNKSHGLLSSAGSLGMLMLWDVESGFSFVDRYSYSSQSFIKAGAALAHGILSTNITSEMDAAQALLSEHVDASDVDLKVAAILGLGISYAGTAREDVLELLVPKIVQEGQPMEVVATTVLALGLVYVGTNNDDVCGSIIEAFMSCSDTDLRDSSARLMCLGLALIFLGSGDDCEGALNAIKVIQHPIAKYLEVTVETAAWACSGSVLAIQKFLSICAEHIDDEPKEDASNTGAGAAGGAAGGAGGGLGLGLGGLGALGAPASSATSTTTTSTPATPPDPLRGMHQEAAVLGLAIVAMGEELSSEMALRSLDHLLQYSEVNIRRVVPLALSLLSISNPRLTVLDTLSKLSHDNDERVSQNAIFAMGLLGAGTNNSRIATALRGLAGYYSTEPNHLFLCRIAQGLLHMGKGLCTLNPIHSDDLLSNKAASAALLTILHAACDMKNTLLGKRHYLLYTLACAIRPRCLMILDEDLKPLAIPVRVGQKVDTVGQAGKPKSITGFQTHKSPVLIGAGERAELATEEYLPLSATLEGFVIVKKNPDYKPT